MPTRRRGALVHLSDEDLEAIAKASQERVVRWNRNKTAAKVFSVGYPGYRPAKDDIPISEFIYIEPIADADLPSNASEDINAASLKGDVLRKILTKKSSSKEPRAKKAPVNPAGTEATEAAVFGAESPKQPF